MIRGARTGAGSGAAGAGAPVEPDWSLADCGLASVATPIVVNRLTHALPGVSVALPDVVRAEVHASRPFEHVAELEAGLADRGRVDERCQFPDVSDHNSVEQRLVAIM